VGVKGGARDELGNQNAGGAREGSVTAQLWKIDFSLASGVGSRSDASGFVRGVRRESQRGRKKITSSETGVSAESGEIKKERLQVPGLRHGRGSETCRPEIRGGRPGWKIKPLSLQS